MNTHKDLEVKLYIDSEKLQAKPPKGKEGTPFFARLRSRQDVTPASHYTMEEIAEAIENGQTIIPADLNKGRYDNTWKEQQLFIIDVDNDFKEQEERRLNEGKLSLLPEGATIEDIAIITPDNAHSLLEGIKPCMMYYTFSHNTAKSNNNPRFRIVFCCEEPITDIKKRDNILKAITRIFDSSYLLQTDTNRFISQVDNSCKNNGRLFYGSTKGSVFYKDYTQTFKVDTALKLYEKQEQHLKQEQAKHKVVVQEPTKTTKDTKVTQTTQSTQYKDDLAELTRRFDFKGYVSRTCVGQWVGNYFNPCPICGHNDDFIIDDKGYNRAKCWSSSGNDWAGDIIDFLMYREDLSRSEAVYKFKYELCGLAKPTKTEVVKPTQTEKTHIYNIEALTQDKPIFITQDVKSADKIREVAQGKAEAIAIGGKENYETFVKELTVYYPTYPLIINFNIDDVGLTEVDNFTDYLEHNEYIHPLYTATYVQANEYDSPTVADAFALNKEVLEENVIDAIKECVKLAQKKAGLISASDYMQDFDKMIKDKSSTKCIPTGFPQLDDVLDGGLYEGIYTIGAISSLGKTTFCLQIADNIAKAGTDVIVFSLEMSKFELMAKSISRETYIQCPKNYTNLAKTTRKIMSYKEQANFNEKELELLQKAKRTYSQFAKHIYINEGIGDLGVSTVTKTLEKMFKFKNQEGYKPVVIIDYLQILAPKNDRLSDKQALDKNIIDLKRLSREYKIPIILISSLNRASYDKKNNKFYDISMADFKESGAIEYSSDVLIGLQLRGMGNFKTQADLQEHKSKHERDVELHILKNRNGRLCQPLAYEYKTLFNYYRELGNN